MIALLQFPWLHSRMYENVRESNRRRKKNLIGCKFGRLSPLEEKGRSPHGAVLWKCVCDCGTITIKPSSVLLKGDTRSCGCLAREYNRSPKKHGHTVGRKASPEFLAWKNMRNRCRKPSHPQFKNYGARGITVCERWKTFSNFLSDVGLRPSPELSLHRINNDLGYNPLNVKWATSAEQHRSMRRNVMLELQGKIQTLTDWASEKNLNPVTLYLRLKRGWSVERALETPAGIYRKTT